MSNGLTGMHTRRLRQVWRSAGWPCQDMVEVELLAAGLLERLRDAQGRECLRVTDAGIAVLAQSLQKNRAARDAHEQLVARVALAMQHAGRIVWRGLSLRARVGDAPWAMAMPDVYSIRNTSVEAYVEPIVHEVKVTRADLLSDLRQLAKRGALPAAEQRMLVRDPRRHRRAAGDSARMRRDAGPRRGAGGGSRRAEAPDAHELRPVDGAGPGPAGGQ